MSNSDEIKFSVILGVDVVTIDGKLLPLSDVWEYC